jgi:tetratricopeptide (TPR) repeat protein
VYQGDIRQRDKIPALAKDRKKGRHARRVMEAYEEWYKIYPKNKFLKRFKRFIKIKPELNILRIMGLFDRPVEKGAVEALKGESAIDGITQKIQQLSEEDWQWALSNLRTANLLSKADPQKPGTLDCHPLIREHFGEKLKEENPGGWKEAHTRLYHYYKNLPGKDLPDTLPEMEPLFAAVAHGCAAGLHREALDDVYWQRISRREEVYTGKKLGAFAADLAAASHFFQKPWSQPADGLSDFWKANVLNWAGFRLRAIGRLPEAIQPFEASLKAYMINKNWKFAAINAGNLSQLLLILGRVEESVAVARQGLSYADKSRDWEQKMKRRANLANVLHQYGEIAEVEQLFREAESLQKKNQPEYKYLYSLQGFRYCDLRLEQGHVQEVLERAEHALEIILNGSKNLLDIAINNLTLGQVWLRQGLDQKNKNNAGAIQKAHEYVQWAVEGLRKAGQQQFLPPGLLIRASYYQVKQDFEKAWKDLNEAFEIAELG